MCAPDVYDGSPTPVTGYMAIAVKAAAFAVFFCQAEDGIRDVAVTGVQTCALPISIFARLGVPLDPARIARGLSIAYQQVVESGKAISLEARVIVMDEPTAALSAAEVDRLFDVVRTLRAAGTAVLFISHRLEEVFALCQRVTVMRDGRHVLTKPIEELTTQSIIRAMVGRDMEALFPTVPTEPGSVVLKVDRLT